MRRSVPNFWLALGLLLGTASYVLAEDVIIVGYHPSPRGSFRSLRTTDNTILASAGGASRGLNIATMTVLPLLRLQVNGNVRFQTLRIADGTQNTNFVLIAEDNAGNAHWQGITGTFSWF